MKKLLVVMVALVLAVPAFAADINIWFTMSEDSSAYIEGAQAPGEHTLYLWAENTRTDVPIVSIGLDLRTFGAVETEGFLQNKGQLYVDFMGSQFESGFAWDVFTGSPDNPLPTPVDLGNLRFGAVGTNGIPYVGQLNPDFANAPYINTPLLLGTLTGTFDIESGIEMYVGTMGMAKDDANDPQATANFWSVLPFNPEYGFDGPFAGTGEGGVVGFAVPEPTTMVLLGLGVLGVIRRRR